MRAYMHVCQYACHYVYGNDQKTALDVCLPGLRALGDSPVSVSLLSVKAQICTIGI